MKALLFESKSQKEIRLSNGVQFFAETEESKEDFIARVTESIDRDYVDTLDLEEVDPAKFKKYSVKQLQKMRPNKTGVELRMIQEVLVERGALEEHSSEDGMIINGTQTDEDIPAEGENPNPSENESPKQKTPKNDKTPKKGEAPKTDEEPKKLKKQMSDEEALAQLETAKENKGKTVTFLCTKTKAEATGTIKGVRLDKRNNFIQYRIEVEETVGEETIKAMYGKGIDSEDLKISE